MNDLKPVCVGDVHPGVSWYIRGLGNVLLRGSDISRGSESELQIYWGAQICSRGYHLLQLNDVTSYGTNAPHLTRTSTPMSQGKHWPLQQAWCLTTVTLIERSNSSKSSQAVYVDFDQQLPGGCDNVWDAWAKQYSSISTTWLLFMLMKNILATVVVY